MGQDQRINPGKFTEQMFWYFLQTERDSSGAVNSSWVKGKSFLANVTKDVYEKASEQYQKVQVKKLSFTTWKIPVNVEFKIEYRGFLYEVDSISDLGRFAEYTCTYNSNEKDGKVHRG